MLPLRRNRARSGRAVAWANVEENIRHTDSDAASEKEKRCDKKEVADSNAQSFSNNKEEKLRDSNAQRFATTEKEVVTHSLACGNTGDISDAYAVTFAPSQAKRFTHGAAVRVAVGNCDAC